MAPPEPAATPVVARAKVAPPDPSTQEVPVVPTGTPPTVARGQVSLPAPPVLEPPTVPSHATVPARSSTAPAGTDPAFWKELPVHLRPRGRGRAIADPTFAGPTGQLPAVGPPGKKRGRQPGRRRRPGRGRAVLLTIVLLLLVGAAGGVAVARLHLLDRATAPQIEVPSGAALRGPGIEPPAAGDWPASWAKFGPNDKTRQLSSLSGVGFSFRVLDSWNCTNRPEASGAAHYLCGPSGSADQVGGDLIVRTCPAPCDSDQRVELRQKEDAWGRQWTRAGGYVTWAETRAFPGTPRYGLVVVGYWRSVAEGAIDRQVVIRMLAPPDKAADLQKVANDIYDAIT
jgi:hypothetical protein